MKALRLHNQNFNAENLFFEEAPAPELKAGEILVKVRGCAITKSELTWPEVQQDFDGTKREFIIPGHEVSGMIEAVADDVDDLKIGDEIYALVDFDCVGAAAELVAVRAADAALKPESIDFTESAAVPLAGLTAWQALFDHAGITAGQKILIHGAAGGVGSFAVQFAHWAGAYVICTARGEDEKFLEDLGADEVLDYESVKFEDVVKRVDLVFDTIGGETLDKSWSVLRPGGTLVTVHTPAKGENPVGPAQDWGVRGILFIVKPNRKQLTEIRTLIDEGRIKSIIDRVYPLSDGRSAFERLEGTDKHKRGKIVLTID